MSRVDYIDDPAAPAANSVVPSAVACVVDEEGRVLMIHKTDNDLWALPGGAHELGETIADTVRREVAEETGYTIEVLALTGTYTNPKHVMAYDDGEVRQQFSLCFRARVLYGRPRPSSESKEVAWVAPGEIERLPLHPSMRRRIADALSGGDVHIS
jgi:8-oxo-dGTP pyrophosphatase MutT (NUDIX family)